MRSAEFGFLGVVVYTRVHTPRFCGDACSAGTVDFLTCCLRGCLTNWLPFLVIYPLILMVFSIVASLPLFLGWLVLGPVIMGSIFASYRDIYTA